MNRDTEKMENREEQEIIEEISLALHEMAEEEREVYDKMKAPFYHKPAYHWWWAIAPLGMITLFLIILYILPPTTSTAPQRSKIATRTIETHTKAVIVSGDKIDEQIFQLEEEVNFLKEANNG